MHRASFLGQAVMVQNPSTQYADDRKLAARQRFWAECRREPAIDLYGWVLTLAGLERGDLADVLDVGCGNGPYERLLQERDHRGRIVAIDLSLGMLRTVRDGWRVQADVEALPLPDAAFDVVLAPHMLYHVPSVPAAAHECRRVLRDDGVFIAVTNGEDNIRPYCDLIEAAVGTGWRMRRPAEDHFSLENGREQLACAFRSVERVDCPPSDVVVTDLDLLTDYIASIGDHYETEVDAPWQSVVESARGLAESQLAAAGELRWPARVGAFVCR